MQPRNSGGFENLLKSTASEEHYVLRLYVTGSTSRSSRAISSVHSLCEEYLHGRYELKVIDIYQQPDDAQAEHIIAAPTLVKSGPGPSRRVVGDLSDPRKIVESLDISPDHPTSPEALP
jgi:circadian clock protein KaiB